MGPGLLVALTLPGAVLLLLAVAVAEQVLARLGRRSPLTRTRRHALTAGGLEVFSAALAPGRAADLETRQVRELRREDVPDGAPPRSRVDLDAGIARLVGGPGAGAEPQP